jgi:Beta propeller domain
MVIPTPVRWVHVSLCLTVIVALPVSAQDVPAGARLRPFASDVAVLRWLDGPEPATRSRNRGRRRVRTSTGTTATATAVPAVCAAPIGISIDSSLRGRGRSEARVTVRAATAEGAPLQQSTVGADSVRAQTDSVGVARIPIANAGEVEARSVTMFARRIGMSPRSWSVKLRDGDRVTVDVPLCAQEMQLSAVTVTGASADAITNVQTEGVDEGGIVKRRGNLLIILRRGRLFTVSTASNALRPIAQVDAYGPGVDPRGTWYDEMLVAGNRVVVVGYSYSRGGTELGVFALGQRGTLRHLDTYQLTGSDYYSSRNYAARLIGTELIVYTPVPLRRSGAKVRLPALRHWRPAGQRNGDTAMFRPILTSNRIFRVDRDEDGARNEATLHTVIRCDIAASPMRCGSTAVAASPGHVFHVSRSAVYVAAVPWQARSFSATTIFRLPLSGAAPSAIRVNGAPLDQFSFLERRGALHLVLLDGGQGDGMWPHCSAA